MQLYVGLIEWDSSENPSIVIGETEIAVKRQAAEILSPNIDSFEDDSCGKLPENATDDQVTAWMDEFCDGNTVPHFQFQSKQDVTLIGPAVQDVIEVVSPY